MDLIVIGSPTIGHSLSVKMHRAIESVTAANEGIPLIIVNPNENNTLSNQSLSMLPETIYHLTVREYQELKHLDDLSWIKLNRQSVSKFHQYKRIFIPKPNRDLLSVIKAKGFIRQRIYH